MRVLNKMKDLVATGVRRVPEMQRHVAEFVRNMFSGEAVPPKSDARYWPTGKAVLNCIYRETRKLTLVPLFHVSYLSLCSNLSCYTVLVSDSQSPVHTQLSNLSVYFCLVTFGHMN